MGPREASKNTATFCQCQTNAVHSAAQKTGAGQEPLSLHGSTWVCARVSWRWWLQQHCLLVPPFLPFPPHPRRSHQGSVTVTQWTLGSRSDQVTRGHPYRVLLLMTVFPLIVVGHSGCRLTFLVRIVCSASFRVLVGQVLIFILIFGRIALCVGE